MNRTFFSNCSEGYETKKKIESFWRTCVAIMAASIWLKFSRSRLPDFLRVRRDHSPHTSSEAPSQKHDSGEHEDRQPDRQAELQDVSKETGTMHAGIVRDRFHHEIRAVADVG